MCHELRAPTFGLHDCDASVEMILKECEDFGIDGDVVVDDGFLVDLIDSKIYSATGYHLVDTDDDRLADLDTLELFCAYGLVEYHACTTGCDFTEECDAVCETYGTDLRPMSICNATAGEPAWEECCSLAPPPGDDEADDEAQCGDSTTWHKKQAPSSDCGWVGAKTGTRCLAKGEGGVYAFEECKSTCGSCDEACADSATWHKTDEPDKDCAWVKRVFNRCAVNGPEGLAKDHCRFACNTCNPAICPAGN